MAVREPRELACGLLVDSPDDGAIDDGAGVVGERDLAQLPVDVRKKTGLVVVDVRMPPTHTTEGLDAARAIRAEHPNIGILVLSHHVETANALELVHASVGGIGYLLKDHVADPTTFIDAVHEVAHGGTSIDPDVVMALLQRRRRVDPLAALTTREREVLALMAEGRSNAAIAATLVLSPKTIESHVSQIFTKLGLGEEPHRHRRVAAVLSYLRDAVTT